MTKHYEISVCKSTEVDIYNDGCQPETWQDQGEIANFNAKEAKGIGHAIEAHLCIKLKDCTAYEGYLEYSQHETALGDIPSKAQVKAWKLGDLKLYNASYQLIISENTVNYIDAGKLCGVKES